MTIVFIYGLPNTDEFKRNLSRLRKGISDELRIGISRAEDIPVHIVLEAAENPAISPLNITCTYEVCNYEIGDPRLNADLKERIESVIDKFCKSCKPNVNVTMNGRRSDKIIL